MVNVKDVQLGTTTRKSFAKINEVMQMPNLIEVQKKSYQWFLDEGLKEVFRDIGSITDNSEKLVLDFGGVTFCDSSGIAVVTGRRKLMRSVGGEVELTNLTRPVEAVFRMANLEKIVTIRRDR